MLPLIEFLLYEHDDIVWNILLGMIIIGDEIIIIVGILLELIYGCLDNKELKIFRYEKLILRFIKHHK